MSVHEHIKAPPPAGTGNLLPKKTCTAALAFVTAIAWATSASAQSAPAPTPDPAADSRSEFVRPFGQ